MPFPAARDKFVNKDEMADYLEAYAQRMELPVRGGMTVDRLSQQGDRFLVSAGGWRLVADNVIVAMSNCQVPWVPPFATDLDPGIAQLHSKEYKSPSQLHGGPVLIVGAGNSGADIAIGGRQEPPDMDGRQGVRPHTVPDRAVVRAERPHQHRAFRGASRPER